MNMFQQTVNLFKQIDSNCSNKLTVIVQTNWQ